MIPSLEGWPTEAKEAPSPHEVRLTSMDNNPVFLCLREKIKKRHVTPKQLLKTLYFSLFNSNLRYGCQIWGKDQNEEFKKTKKLQEKTIRIINFLLLNAPVEKQMYEMNVLKLQRTSSYFKISFL